MAGARETEPVHEEAEEGLTAHAERLSTGPDGRNRHRLEVNLAEGAIPVMEVYFDSEASMRQTAARLGDALWFGPA